MKKTITILLLIAFIICSSTIIFAYDIEITKENLQEAFNIYAEGGQR